MYSLPRTFSACDRGGSRAINFISTTQTFLSHRLSSMPISRNQKQFQLGFAYRNTFHSPLSPALTLASVLCRTDNSESSTNVSRPYTISYYAPQFPAKPPHCVRRLRPHPLLESAAVNWDLMENPSTITLNYYSLSSQLLVEQATTPPLPALSVTSIYLPWTINVRASNGSYVTFEDLFKSVYRSLRTIVTTIEFNLFLHQTDQKRATRAYEQRCRRFRSVPAHDKEKRGGMKRVDFLMGHTKFHSISNTGHRSDEWRLNVS